MESAKEIVASCSFENLKQAAREHTRLPVDPYITTEPSVDKSHSMLSQKKRRPLLRQSASNMDVRSQRQLSFGLKEATMPAIKSKVGKRI